MPSPIVQAIKQICEEKNISYESVLETIEAALAAAYRKDFGEKNQNVKVIFDPESASMRIFDVKTVVEDMELPEEGIEPDLKAAEISVATPPTAEGVLGEEEKKFNPKTMIMISEAQKLKPDAELNEEIRTELSIPGEFGRMAAQTAKQVIMQKLRKRAVPTGRTDEGVYCSGHSDLAWSGNCCLARPSRIHPKIVYRGNSRSGQRLGGSQIHCPRGRGALQSGGRYG